MACKICGRSSCTSSFHSIEQQEAFAERQEMSSDVDELRCDIQDLNEEIASLRNDVIEECVRVAEAHNSNATWRQGEHEPMTIPREIAEEIRALKKGGK